MTLPRAAGMLGICGAAGALAMEVLTGIAGTPAGDGIGPTPGKAGKPPVEPIAGVDGAGAVGTEATDVFRGEEALSGDVVAEGGDGNGLEGRGKLGLAVGIAGFAAARAFGGMADAPGKVGEVALPYPLGAV